MHTLTQDYEMSWAIRFLTWNLRYRPWGDNIFSCRTSFIWVRPCGSSCKYEKAMLQTSTMVSFHAYFLAGCIALNPKAVMICICADSDGYACLLSDSTLHRAARRTCSNTWMYRAAWRICSNLWASIACATTVTHIISVLAVNTHTLASVYTSGHFLRLLIQHWVQAITINKLYTGESWTQYFTREDCKLLFWQNECKGR